MSLKPKENQLTGGKIGAEVRPQLSRRIFAEGQPDAGPGTISVSDVAASAGKQAQG
jgi:hypothetical protein